MCNLNSIEPVNFTFDSIFSQTLGSYDNGNVELELEILLPLVRNDGLREFEDYCLTNNIKYKLEKINDECVNLVVTRPSIQCDQKGGKTVL